MNKGKKIVLTLVAISSISVSTVLASQDVAREMDTWYNEMLRQSQQSATEQFQSYAESLKPELEEEKNKLVVDTNSRLAAEADKVTKRSSVRIDTYLGNYLTKLWDKSDQLIEGQIESDFDAYVDAKNAEVSAYIEDEANLLLKELEKELEK
jgi:oligoendopeptidase F